MKKRKVLDVFGSEVSLELRMLDDTVARYQWGRSEASPLSNRMIAQLTFTSEEFVFVFERKVGTREDFSFVKSWEVTS